MTSPTDDQRAVELERAKADALLSGLKVGRLPDGTHFPSNIEAVLSFARWYASTRIDQATAEAAVLVDAAKRYRLKRCYHEMDPCNVAEHDAYLRTEAMLDRAIRRNVPLAQAFLAEHEKLKARVAELEAQVYCPGLWRCAKCKLGMVCKSLNVNVGTVTANESPQQCPNGCGPMWRVTERENRIEMQDGYEAAMAELAAAKANQRTPGTVEVCENYQSIDCAMHEHYGNADNLNPPECAMEGYATCPLRAKEPAT